MSFASMDPNEKSPVILFLVQYMYFVFFFWILLIFFSLVLDAQYFDYEVLVCFL